MKKTYSWFCRCKSPKFFPLNWSIQLCQAPGLDGGREGALHLGTHHTGDFFADSVELTFWSLNIDEH